MIYNFWKYVFSLVYFLSCPCQVEIWVIIFFLTHPHHISMDIRRQGPHLFHWGWGLGPHPVTHLGSVMCQANALPLHYCSGPKISSSIDLLSCPISVATYWWHRWHHHHLCSKWYHDIIMIWLVFLKHGKIQKKDVAREGERRFRFSLRTWNLNYVTSSWFYAT